MSSSRTANILVFDSGVGGLSICQALNTRAPALKIHYLSDNAAFPYGEKSENFLVERASKVIDIALQSIQADIIVIACNTASTVVLPVLRQRLSIPIVGVVPAIKTAAEKTKTNVIGLLATPGTVARHYTLDLINEFANGKTVISVGSSDLVTLAENYLYSGEIDEAAIKQVLDRFDTHEKADEMDIVVLGCTHFPLIREQLAALRPAWTWVDSGNAIASRVMSLLEQDAIQTSIENSIQNCAPTNRHRAWFTRLDTSSQQLQDFLDQHHFGDARLLEIAG